MKVATSRNLVLTTLTMLSVICCPGRIYSQQRTTISKVVIDPGHGGKDPGTVSTLYKEKDITLKVGLRLGELIEEHYPDVEVIYTRKTDVFIPLNERGDIANKAKADLFISIHVNGAPDKSASGTETFVMGIDKSGGNLGVAMRENDVVTFEDDYSQKYEGYQAGSAESYIIFSLMQYSHLEQSLYLADLVQTNYHQNVKLGNRGVKQAAFLVLWRTAMPSILTELGFISNSKDEKLMASREGQDKYARCLFNAFSAYKTKTDGRGQRIVLGDSSISSTGTGVQAKPQQKPAAGAATAQSKPSTATASSSPSKVVFCVQVCSSKTQLDMNHERFASYRGKIKERNVNGLYKYFVGEYASYQDALDMQARVRKEIKDCFIAAFNDNQPIALAEARKLSGK